MGLFWSIGGKCFKATLNGCLWLFYNRRVLGYSDADFLFTLPYSELRYFGLDIFTSLQVVLTTVFLGWIGAYIFFACLRLNFSPSIIGAIVFSFQIQWPQWDVLSYWQSIFCHTLL
jgi:hypothetical protein